jgi:hypothetical protein
MLVAAAAPATTASAANRARNAAELFIGLIIGFFGVSREGKR